MQTAGGPRTIGGIAMDEPDTPGAWVARGMAESSELRHPAADAPSQSVVDLRLHFSGMVVSFKHDQKLHGPKTINIIVYVCLVVTCPTIVVYTGDGLFEQLVRQALAPRLLGVRATVVVDQTRPGEAVAVQPGRRQYR